MFNAERIIDALLAEIGTGGVFHIDAMSILGVKGCEDSVVRREQIPYTVPGIVQARFRESAQYGADDVIG